MAGRNIASVGKRVDALMQTAGLIRSLVFAEFKTHRTPLVDPKAYRSGCFAPSVDLGGGIVQIQGTVQRALEDIGVRLSNLAPDGSELPGESTYMFRPRAFLIIGRLSELQGEHGGVHMDRFRSFELYRRNTVEPEIVTYDELLARAEWHVAVS